MVVTPFDLFKHFHFIEYLRPFTVDRFPAQVILSKKQTTTAY
jgi:hypothetical protein